ncbi:hypothetical protein ACWGTI_27190 [Mesorhizobium sp. ArgA1]
MAKRTPNAIDADILRSTFQKAVKEENIPEIRWREYATKMATTYTGLAAVNCDLVDWIVHTARE